MKNYLATALIAATATLTGFVSKVDTASAAGFVWDNSWTQPTIYTKAQTGFDDAPFQQFVSAERLPLANSGLLQLDPSKLQLNYDHDVTAYFINQVAWNRNQLAYQATGTTNQSGLVFQVVPSNDPQYASDPNNYLLKPGDGVKLGTITAGTQLDFFLRANGYNSGNSSFTFSTEGAAANPDGLQHVVSFAYAKDEYVVLGFEDLFGAYGGEENSDRDFNDLVVVLDVGKGNLVSVPEPSVALSMVAIGAVSILGLRRRRQTNTAN